MLAAMLRHGRFRPQQRRVPKGHACSFEPNQTTFKKLQTNPNTNRITNVAPKQAAASSSSGKISSRCYQEHAISCVLNY